MRPTVLFRLYQIGAGVVLPFAARSSAKKLRRAGVSTDRAHERLGHATLQRPLGTLIWFHGASIGEAKSVLPLMAHLQGHAQMLLTSGTATSASVVANRLPEGAMHQFGPLDGFGPLTRFLDHWRPDLCVLIESELWPNLLDICARRKIPVALLNANISEKSARGWKNFQGTAHYVVRGIKMAHCQNARSRNHFRTLGIPEAVTGQNLKSIVEPHAFATSTIDATHRTLGNRPQWVAASTHASDEKLVLSAHKMLLADHPQLCLILAPRHPDRARQIGDLIRKMGMTMAQRSTGSTLSKGAQVYLADTVGETELWYALSPIVFLGGSFSDVGGHSPYEAAAAHSAIIHGPQYANYAEVYEVFQASDASIRIVDDVTLANSVHTLLSHPSRAAQLAANARQLTCSGTETLGELSSQLCLLAGIETTTQHD